MRIDLHNHTKYSDGVLTPEELVDRAISNGVDIFALTDHDSSFGCKRIQEAAKGKNIRVINGMELSTEYKGKSVHIVCLYKDNIIPTILSDYAREHMISRYERAEAMLEKVTEIYGLKTDIVKLQKDSTVITRGNMVRHLQELNNLTYEEARYYVGHKSKAYIPSAKMSTEEGVRLAREAGCFVIFAHPCLVNPEHVEEILQYGFDGIEVRYPSEKNDEDKFVKLAKKYNLLISAGSDCHGDESHGDIGDCTLNEEEFAPIAKAINFKLEV